MNLPSFGVLQSVPQVDALGWRAATEQLAELACAVEAAAPQLWQSPASRSYAARIEDLALSIRAALADCEAASYLADQHVNQVDQQVNNLGLW